MDKILNKKAAKYKQQNSLPSQEEMASAFLEGLDNMTKRLLALEEEVKILKIQASSASNQARVGDYRSLALAKLLETQISKDALSDKILEIQGKEFDASSKRDDESRKLIVADDETAKKGMIAISMIQFFDQNGTEKVEQRIVRSKYELGKEEIFKGLDEATEGLTVGKSKMVAVELKGITHAEVTLLGLRKVQV